MKKIFLCLLIGLAASGFHWQSAGAQNSGGDSSGTGTVTTDSQKEWEYKGYDDTLLFPTRGGIEMEGAVMTSLKKSTDTDPSYADFISLIQTRQKLLNLLGIAKYQADLQSAIESETDPAKKASLEKIQERYTKGDFSPEFLAFKNNEKNKDEYEKLKKTYWTYFQKSESDKILLNGVVGQNTDWKFAFHYIPEIINIILKFIAPLVVGLFIYAGIKFVYAGSDEETLKSAKQFLMYAIIGLLIIVVSYSVMKLVYFLVSAG